MDNITMQSDEIEALKAIYDDQWVIEDINNLYSIQIDKNVKLYVTLNSEYPSTSPPTYELWAPTLSSHEKNLVGQEFQNIFEENIGEPIIFQWIEKLKEIAQNNSKSNAPVEPKAEESEVDSSTIRILKIENNLCIDKTNINKSLDTIVHGPIITDRKSVFQGHACKVETMEGVQMFRDTLLANKKIAQATHNMSAYRIILPNHVAHQDFDDDGETHAGGRLLHLLQMLKLDNVMVIVTRWYGGIHLGPDRFKHINNAARQVLVEGEFIKS